MDAFDSLVNSWIQPSSVGAGVGAVLLSFFTGKIAPKFPKKFYRLLDNTLVRIAVTAYLLNQQFHQPSLAVIIGVVIVLGFELLVKVFAPETPPLSDLVKSVTSDESGASDSSQKGCNCYCGHTIYAEGIKDPKRGSSKDSVVQQPNKTEPNTANRLSFSPYNM